MQCGVDDLGVDRRLVGDQRKQGIVGQECSFTRKR
jgi:hypothetical protein